MCRRTFCPDCDAELIHRDNRKGYESASALGQVVSRDGPRTFTVGDVDLYVLKFLGRRPLLRLLEHKQPGSRIKPMQKRALQVLVVVFEAAIDIGALDPRSGVFLMRGEVYANPDGRRETRLGPQRIWDARQREWFDLESQEDVFAWMDARRELVPPVPPLARTEQHRDRGH